MRHTHIEFQTIRIMKAATGADYARICAKHNLPISKNQIGDSGEKILGFAMSYFPFFTLYFLDGNGMKANSAS